LLTILKNGDHIVSSSSLYGGTYNLLKVFLPRIGISTTFVDHSTPTNFRDAISDKTKAIFLETIPNPKLDVPDFTKIIEIAHDKNIPVIVDNTSASPFLFRPIEFGADIIVHSLTKFIGGHGTSLGGIVVDSGNFNWGNGNFPEFTEPSAGYHGLKYWEKFKGLSFIVKLRVETLRDTGAAISPYNSFQILQGLETLGLRMKKHSQNALEVAQFLEKHENVEWVSYNGLDTHPSYKISKKYLKSGFGGLVTFGVKGGYEKAKKFVDNTKLFSLLANIGDAKSLIIHPASTTHQQLSFEEKISSGVTDDLIRLSIGLEDTEDIINDLKNTFKKI